MNKPLATNREILQKALGRVASGIRRKPRSISLINLPGIAEIEVAITTPGWEWRPENDDLQQRVDQASIALFGITEAQTRRIPLDGLTAVGPDERYDHSRHGPMIDASERECAEWEARFADLEKRLASDNGVYELYGITLRDDAGRQFASTSKFARQIYAAGKCLVQGAKFTLDGGGRTKVSAEDWGAALERAAREFKPTRR